MKQLYCESLGCKKKATRGGKEIGFRCLKHYNAIVDVENGKRALFEAYRKQTMGDCDLDFGSMTLLVESPTYWIIRYDEGQAEFINLVYKKGGLETIEIQ